MPELAWPNQFDPSIAGAVRMPWALTVDLLDLNMDDDARRDIAHREGRAGSDVGTGESIHDLQRATLGDRCATTDHYVGMQPVAGVFLRFERHAHTRVASEVPELVLVRVIERGEDEFITLESGPRERDVRRAIGRQRHDMRKRAGGK